MLISLNLSGIENLGSPRDADDLVQARWAIKPFVRGLGDEIDPVVLHGIDRLPERIVIDAFIKPGISPQ